MESFDHARYLSFESLMEMSRPNSEDRENVSISHISEDALAFVADASALLDRELQLLLLEAQLAADSYWSVQREVQYTGVKGEQCSIGTRVRIINGTTLALDWYRNSYKDTKETIANNAKKKVYSRYIPKGTSDSYSMQLFKNEPLWARELIEFVEGKYAHLRRKSAAISKARRSINQYAALLAKE